jgi:hypothetical protein
MLARPTEEGFLYVALGKATWFNIPGQKFINISVYQNLKYTLIKESHLYEVQYTHVHIHIYEVVCM